MKVRRDANAAARYHAIAVALRAMAWHAVDIEPFLAAFEQPFVYGDRDSVEEDAIGFAGVRRIGIVQFIARNGACGNGTGIAAIGEKVVRTKRLVFGLILHILTAAEGHEEGEGEEEG